MYNKLIKIVILKNMCFQSVFEILEYITIMQRSRLSIPNFRSTDS